MIAILVFGLTLAPSFFHHLYTTCLNQKSFIVCSSAFFLMIGVSQLLTAVLFDSIGFTGLCVLLNLVNMFAIWFCKKYVHDWYFGYSIHSVKRIPLSYFQQRQLYVDINFRICPESCKDVCF